jgi:hypothetical protein
MSLPPLHARSIRSDLTFDMIHCCFSSRRCDKVEAVSKSETVQELFQSNEISAIRKKSKCQRLQPQAQPPEVLGTMRFAGFLAPPWLATGRPVSRTGQCAAARRCGHAAERRAAHGAGGAAVERVHVTSEVTRAGLNINCPNEEGTYATALLGLTDAR